MVVGVWCYVNFVRTKCSVRFFVPFVRYNWLCWP